MSNRCINILAILVFLFPNAAIASVTFSEIMYDPEGSDSSGSHFRDWIELYNSGASIDFSTWKFFEGGANHSISAYAGGAMIPTGGYAILADDPSLFLAEYPGFSGIIFDTVFSGGLKNESGEILTLRDTSLVDTDTVTYNPALGAGGDGDSLQKIGSSWTAAAPTPVAAAGFDSGSSPPPPGDSESDSPSATTTVSQGVASGNFPEPQMFAYAGPDRTVVAGASVIFEGQAIGLKKEPITGARFVWSFGNGDQKEGSSVLYEFPYPGIYVVVLDVSSGWWSASDRLVVTAVPADVSITEVSPSFMVITNRSAHELDLGLWMLAENGKTFTFPRNTIILPHEAIKVSNKITGLSGVSASAVSLLYPNGTLAGAHQEPLIIGRVPAKPEQAAPSKSMNILQETAPHFSEAPTSVIAASVVAFDSAVPPKNTGGILMWILPLLAVVGLGIGAVFLIRHTKHGSGYTIIEDKS